MRTYDQTLLDKLADPANPCTVVVRIGKLYDPKGQIAQGILGQLSVRNAQVYPSTDSIRLDSPHGLETGDALTYYRGVNAGLTYYIAPLTDGQVVYAIKVSVVELKFAASYADAIAGTAINITSGLSGAGNYGIDPNTVTPVSRTGTSTSTYTFTPGVAPVGWTTNLWQNKKFIVEAVAAGASRNVGDICVCSSNTATVITSSSALTGVLQIRFILGVDSDVGYFEAAAFTSLAGNVEIGCFSNGPVVGTPPTGALGPAKRWLSGTMPGVPTSYDEQKGSTTIGGIQFDIDNTNGQFTKLVYAQLGTGGGTPGWFKREVWLYLVPSRNWADALLVGRFLLKCPPKDQGLFYKFYCFDYTKLLSGAIDQKEQKFKFRGVQKELVKMTSPANGTTTKTQNKFEFTVDPGLDHVLLTLLIAARRVFLVCVEGTSPAGMLFRITDLAPASTGTGKIIFCASAVEGDNVLGGHAGNSVTKGYIAYVPGSGDDALNPVKDVMGFSYTGLARIQDPVVNDGTLLDTDQKFINPGLEVWTSSSQPGTWTVGEVHSGGAATSTIAKNEDLLYVYGGEKSAKLALMQFTDVTQSSYVYFSENIMGTAAQDIAQRKILVGARCLCGDAGLNSDPTLVTSILGFQAQIEVTYYSTSNCTGTPIATYTSPWQGNLGAQQVFTGDTMTNVVPDWTAWAQEDSVNPVIPIGTLSIKVECRFRNAPYTATGLPGSQQPDLSNCYVDAFSCLIFPAGYTYEDTYVMMDREILDIDAIYADADTEKAWMSVVGRGRLGTLPCRHKRDAQGNIIRVVGGYDYTGQLTQKSGEGHPKAHPLNILLALLTSTEQAHSYYVPWCLVGRDAPTGVVPWRGNNVYYDSGTAKYYGWDIGYGWGMGIPLSYIDWMAICAVRDSAACVDQMAEFRLKEGIKDFKSWSEDEIMRPFGYRWVLGTDGKLSVARVIGDPYGLTPVATIYERDLERPLLDEEYDENVVNKIVLQFDSDPSETTDNAQNSKYVSLHEYFEKTFWDISTGQSSLERFGGVNDPQELTIKSLGMRGVVSSKFANGYNLGSDAVARRRVHDYLLKWRDMLPRRRGTVGLRYGPLDIGDLVYLKNAKLWDLDTGAQWPGGITDLGKKAQITSLKPDYTKKKIDFECVMLDKVPHPGGTDLPYYAALGSGMPTPSYARTGTSVVDVFIAHYSGDSAYEDIKNLSIRDYPFQISNLFFVCQTWGKTYDQLSDFLGANAGDVSSLVHRRYLRVPAFTGYRHTNVRVWNELRQEWVKVAEFNEPYCFFNWIADADTKTDSGKVAGDGVNGPLVRISYSSSHYIPSTGEFEDGYTLGKYVEIDLSSKTFVGTDLGTRYEEQIRERRVSGRRYLSIGSPGENKR